MSRTHTQPVSVLLADDDVRLAAPLEQLLRESNHQSTTCRAGALALPAARRGAFDVLLDWNVPGLSGPEVLPAVRGRRAPGRPAGNAPSMPAASSEPSGRCRGETQVSPRCTVSRAGQHTPLWVRVLDIQALVLTRARRVVRRLTTLNEVGDDGTDLRSNAIEGHIANLRSKLNPPPGRDSSHRVRGAGYLLDADSG